MHSLKEPPIRDFVEKFSDLIVCSSNFIGAGSDIQIHHSIEFENRMPQISRRINAPRGAQLTLSFSLRFLHACVSMIPKMLVIDVPLVSRLIAEQFPQWRGLPIRAVASSGWDNRTFHLGEHMLIRMPSAADYALQVEKEQHWLPKLAPLLPLQIPIPLAMGQPGEGFLWNWSVYQWLEGEVAAAGKIHDLAEFATTLAQFLVAFQAIDTTGGPSPGLHSFYRGGTLANYDDEVRQALIALKGQIDIERAQGAWETALKTSWEQRPVWVHGDVSAGNLLVRSGKLVAVIDFGQLAIGDPACDLAIAWTLFSGESRRLFREILDLDEATWARGRGWTLWKALVVAAGFTDPRNSESAQCRRIIDDVLKDHVDQ